MEKIDFYAKMSAVLTDCEHEVINLIKANGGKIELPVDDEYNFSLVLSCYDINGDTYNTTITSINVATSEIAGDWIELETGEGCTYQLDKFTDTSIIYIYDYIWGVIAPVKQLKLER